MAGDDIDADALQAQIDLAMSLNFNIVSSWAVTPAVGLSNGVPKFETNQKELEQYMNRPPRLGVGAPLPTASIMRSAKDAAHLKHQLTKSNNSGALKRTREEFKASSSRPSAKKFGGSDDSDDEDSRSRTLSSKKSNFERISVFGTPEKKKKRVDDNQASPFVMPATSNPAIPITSQSQTFRPPSPKISLAFRSAFDPEDLPIARETSLTPTASGSSYTLGTSLRTIEGDSEDVDLGEETTTHSNTVIQSMPVNGMKNDSPAKKRRRRKKKKKAHGLPSSEIS